MTLAAVLSLIGVFSLWNCSDDLRNGIISLPTGRHSTITLHLADKSPALILAFIFQAGMVLFFPGGGLLFVRDAVRAEPRTGNGLRRSD